jgi:serine/threonine protein kinase
MSSMPSGDPDIGRLLLDRGLITPSEYEAVVAEHRASGRPVDEILVEHSIVSRGQIEDAIESAVRRGIFCAHCETTVYVRRSEERCPECEEVLPRGEGEDDDLSALLDEDVPPDVRTARQIVSRTFGKYVLLQELGRGGTGVVHKAWDTMLGDYVALKFLREPTDPSVAERRRERLDLVRELLQEARAMRMRHDHILPILDVGRVGRQVYLTMEFIEGRTLAASIAESRKRGRASPLYEDPPFWLRVVRDVCSGVHYAHTFRRPLVHCDLKPGNVLVSKGGTAYVMDFGLARALDLPPDSEFVIRGTPAYMAPEQLTGRSRDIGVWTDVYGLGGILYELLTGKAVFTGDTSKVLQRTTTDLPRRPEEVLRESEERRRHPPEFFSTSVSKLERICMRCLSLAVSDRYPTAAAVADEIDVVLASLKTGVESSQLLPPEIRVERERAATRRRARGESLPVPAPADDEKVKQTTRLESGGVVEMPERFRRRLAERLSAERPSLESLLLADDRLAAVEVVKATAEKIFVFAGGDVRGYEWSRLIPAQVVALAERMELSEPEDCLALGIYCYHTGQPDAARRYLATLAGTPLERTASQILKWLGPGGHR